MRLGSNQEAKISLTLRLERDFHALKTYGKEPESLDSIIDVMLETLADFEPEQIERAWKIHTQRSPEFPTPADIVGLIRRGGKPPLERSIYIAASKKEGCDRTAEEWDYIRDYEREAMQGDPAIVRHPEDVESSATIIRNLKAQLIAEQKENARLQELLRDARQAKGIGVPVIPLSDKVQNTIDYMRKTGASEEDIQEFINSLAA